MTDEQLTVSVEEARVRVELDGRQVVLGLDQAREFEQRFLTALLTAELAELGERPRRVPIPIRLRDDGSPASPGAYPAAAP